MDDTLISSYVNATAELLKLPLEAGRAQRVATHLQRAATLVALLEGVALAPPDELAELYRPAAFPPNDDGCEPL